MIEFPNEKGRFYGNWNSFLMEMGIGERGLRFNMSLDVERGFKV